MFPSNIQAYFKIVLWEKRQRIGLILIHKQLKPPIMDDDINDDITPAKHIQ